MPARRHLLHGYCLSHLTLREAHVAQLRGLSPGPEAAALFGDISEPPSVSVVSTGIARSNSVRALGEKKERRGRPRRERRAPPAQPRLCFSLRGFFFSSPQSKLTETYVSAVPSTSTVIRRTEIDPELLCSRLCCSPNLKLGLCHYAVAMLYNATLSSWRRRTSARARPSRCLHHILVGVIHQQPRR